MGQINNCYPINNTYVFHYLLIIQSVINIPRTALFDFLSIQNTSCGECSAAQHHYCLHKKSDIWERHCWPQIHSFSKWNYRTTIKNYIAVRMLNKGTILHQILVKKEFQNTHKLFTWQPFIQSIYPICKDYQVVLVVL